MKFESTGRSLRVSGLSELNAMNASEFREHARAAIRPEHDELEIDFSGTRFFDSSGLGALISINKMMVNRQGYVSLLNPTPAVMQVLKSTAMHQVFPISYS